MPGQVEPMAEGTKPGLIGGGGKEVASVTITMTVTIMSLDGSGKRAWPLEMESEV